MEERKAPSPSIYDNDITLSYKWAYYYDIPVRLLLVYPRALARTEDLPGTPLRVFEPLEAAVERFTKRNYSYSEIYSRIEELAPSVIDDIIVAYYRVRQRELRGEGLLLTKEDESRLVEEINDFYYFLHPDEPDKYKNFSDFMSHYRESWLVIIENEQCRDIGCASRPRLKSRLQTVLEIQTQLEIIANKPDSLYVSSIAITSVINAYTPTFPYSDPEQRARDLGMDIFNHALASVYVPYIQYNKDAETQLYKVYQGTDVEDKPNFENIVISRDRAKDNHTIYLTLWVESLYEHKKRKNKKVYIPGMHNAPRKAFYRIIYQLETNYLTIETPVRTEPEQMVEDRERARQHVQDALPYIDLGPGLETRVRGNFTLWDVDITEYSFLHLLLTEPLYYTYLYVEENIHPFAFKKRLDVHYRSILQNIREEQEKKADPYISNSASVSVTLGWDKLLVDETHEVLHDPDMMITSDVVPELDKIPFSAGTPFVRVGITRANSFNDIQEFLRIFRLIMRDYRGDITVVNPGETIVTYNVKADDGKIYHDAIYIAPKDVTVEDLGDGKVAIIREDSEEILEGTSDPVEQEGVINTDTIRITIEGMQRDIPTLGKRSRVEGIYRDVLPNVDYELDYLLTERKKRAQKETLLLLAKEIPEGRKEKRPTGKSQGTGKKGEKVLQRLQAYDKELFGAGYARDCQGKNNQPEIIPDDGVEAWLQAHPHPKGGQRTIMKFPLFGERGGMEWNFGCPYNLRPNPGVKLATYMVNKDVIPYVPCCFRRSQWGIREYLAWGEGREIRKVGAKAESKITTNKFLTARGTGTLPTAVTKIVRNYDYDNYFDMVRYGVPRSINSFLHCVCISLDDEGYNNAKDTEDYIYKLRQKISRTVNPIVLKQELYEYSEDEIRAMLGNNDIFLDPALYFRALEEFFQINIFTFIMSEDSNEPGEMEIPRNALFHARTPRSYRNNVVVIKLWGSERDSFVYPQCELCIDYDESRQLSIFLFEEGMRQICHLALILTQTTLTWVRNEEGKIGVYYNISSRINFPAVFFPYEIQSQYIDSEGKMRAFTFRLSDNKNATIITPPVQPEDYAQSPTISKTNVATALDILRNIADSNNPAGGDTIVGEFPTAKSTRKGRIIGIWGQVLDIAYCFYIPVEEDKIPEELRNIPTIPQPELITALTGKTSEPLTLRLHTLRRTLNIIQHLVVWLYELWKRDLWNPDQKPIPFHPDDFAQKYLRYDETQVKDSVYYYNLTGVPRYLPTRTYNEETGLETTMNLEGALEYLSQGDVAPSLVSDGKIIMYSREFYDKILQYLYTHEKNSFGLRPDPKNEILHYYQYTEDFYQQPNVSIFLSSRDFNSWLAIEKQHNLYVAKKDIKVVFYKTTEPYLYYGDIFKTGEVAQYIIQKTVTGDQIKALYVSYLWKMKHINYGYNTPTPADGDIQTPDGPLDILSYPYRLCEIAHSLEVLHKSSHNLADNHTVSLIILEYTIPGHIRGQKEYAAILPLSPAVV